MQELEIKAQEMFDIVNKHSNKKGITTKGNKAVVEYFESVPMWERAELYRLFEEKLLNKVELVLRKKEDK